MAGHFYIKLVGGPQDGAEVVVYEPVPKVIFLQRQWRGDGYATWGRKQCERFPARYELDGNTFVYSSPIPLRGDWPVGYKPEETK